MRKIRRMFEAEFKPQLIEQIEAGTMTIAQAARDQQLSGSLIGIASLGSAAEIRRYIRDRRQELGSVSKACQVSGLAASS